MFNGQLNLAKWLPEFVGKVLGPWRVPAPQDGPGMYRYSETPRMTAEERAALEPPAAMPAPPMPHLFEPPPPRAADHESEYEAE